jgi:SAM-dependent methyltransferase
VPGMQRFVEGAANHVERRTLVEALRRAQEGGFDPGEYVEQESFVRASEIRALAERAGVGPGVSVLDLCCGIAGPGRFLTRELGCDYLGVDASASAVEIARERARGLPCRFEVAEIPPLPPGEFDVVLLLETMLAFRDKWALLEEISEALAVGGRFAFTLEEGRPLSESERARMPDADTVWLTPLDELDALLARAGLAVRWREDWSAPHRATAEALTTAYSADATSIAAQVGARALDELLAAHRLWAGWLATGRVRKFAVVAERTDPVAPVGRRESLQ